MWAPPSRIARRSRCCSTRDRAESDFANEADAGYGVDVDDFAKQMTMIDHAGYETVDLKTFLDFVAGKPVDLPPRPLLLTFDDARADSWTGADGILRKLGFNAVMFVDVGRVEDGDPEYLTWDELRTVQDSGRWQLQLHSGHGHKQIQYGPGPDDYGPYYAYEKQGEDFDGWRERVSPTSRGVRTRSPSTSPRISRSRSHRRTATTARTARTTRGYPTSCSAGSRSATTRSSPRTSTPARTRSRPAARPNPGHPSHTGGDLHDMLLSGK